MLVHERMVRVRKNLCRLACMCLGVSVRENNCVRVWRGLMSLDLADLYLVVVGVLE